MLQGALSKALCNRRTLWSAGHKIYPPPPSQRNLGADSINFKLYSFELVVSKMLQSVYIIFPKVKETTKKIRNFMISCRKTLN